MKQNIKVLLAAAGLVVAVVLVVQGVRFWHEREALAMQSEALAKELALAQQFAATHRDYEGQKKAQEQQLAELERGLQKRGSATECLKLVRRVAAEQGVQVLAVQAQGSEAAKQLGHNLQLTAEGDFFAALRWLRKLEREGIVISSLQVQKKEKAQQLRFEVGIKAGKI